MDIIGFGALNVDYSYEISNSLAKKLHFRSGKEQEGGSLGSLQNLLDSLKKDVLLAKSGGGSAANTIVALSRMGFSTGYLGKIGNDEEGAFLLSNLPNVDTSRILKGEGRSGIVLALQTKSQKDRFLLVFPGDNDRIYPEDIDINYVNQARFLHLTSFVGDQSFQAQIETLEKLKDNVLVSLDAGELYARRGIKALSPFLKKSHIFFPSEEEVKILTETNYKQGARELLYYGASIIVVTLGRRGCYVITKSQEFSVPAFPVKEDAIKDTTGAGDVFAAGFLAGLLMNKSLEECAILANKVAAKSITGMGRTKYPTQVDIQYV